MWNPFKKTKTTSTSNKKTDDNNNSNLNKKTDDDKDSDQNNTQKLGMLQRIAMKKVQNMSSGERNKMMQEAFKPENKDKLMKVMEQMKKTGMISEEQIKLAKEKLGL